MPLPDVNNVDATFGSGSIFGRSDENYQAQKEWFDDGSFWREL